MDLSYRIRRAETPPKLDGKWSGETWRRADTAHILLFRAEGSDHHPDTRVRVLYSEGGLHVLFRVIDRYVRCLATEYQGNVYEDACVEFFVQPKPEAGYFNFEMNCGGALLLKYIEDARRTGDSFAKSTNVVKKWGSQVQVYHSLPRTVDPEIVDRVEWTVEYFVPFALFEHYLGPLGDVAGQEWRGNFYKCAENNSHPHWGSWAPIGKDLNFHAPGHFAPLRFEPQQCADKVVNLSS